MFGLEKNDMEKFQFDLEKELKANPAKSKEYKDHFGKNQKEIKTLLRAGSKSDEFHQLECIASGYEAAERVMNRTVNSISK